MGGAGARRWVNIEISEYDAPLTNSSQLDILNLLGLPVSEKTGL